MRRLAAVTLALSSAALAVSVEAQPHSIQTVVDRNQVAMGDQITLQVKVEGSRSAYPKLPDLPDFQVIQSGKQEHFELRNMQRSVSVAYNYVLIPRRPGTFTIGPARVEIDGEEYESRPFTIRVLDASTAPGRETKSRDLFLTATVSNDEPSKPPPAPMSASEKSTLTRATSPKSATGATMPPAPSPASVVII